MDNGEDDDDDDDEDDQEAADMEEYEESGLLDEQDKVRLIYLHLELDSKF